MKSVPTTTDRRRASQPVEPKNGRQHGERACYVKDKCRCPDCSAANARHKAELEAKHKKGVPVRVDATRAREHIDQLIVAGMGIRGIARASDLSATTLHHIDKGRTKKISPETERRIVEVRMIEPGEHPSGIDDAGLASFNEAARKLGLLDRSWVDRAACRRPDVEAEIFHAATTDNTPRALVVCAACVVRGPCLRYALAAGEDTGVWGGTTPAERRQLDVQDIAS